MLLKTICHTIKVYHWISFDLAMYATAERAASCGQISLRGADAMSCFKTRFLPNIEAALSAFVVSVAQLTRAAGKGGGKGEPWCLPQKIFDELLPEC